MGYDSSINVPKEIFQGGSAQFCAKDSDVVVLMLPNGVISKSVAFDILPTVATNDYDFASDAIETIFGVVPRIALASLTAYAISQMLDVYLFDKIKKKFPGKNKLYIRNIGSTLVSQFVDSMIFVPIAFLTLGEFLVGYPNEIVFEIFWTTYIIKLIVAILDTPFVYIIRAIKPLDLLDDNELKD